MAELGNNKKMLLNQVRSNPTMPLADLAKLLQTYSDLSVEDFRGIVSDTTLDQLAEAGRNPQEREAWDKINNAPRSTVAEIQALQDRISDYLSRYPNAPKAQDAQMLSSDLHNQMAAARERQRRQEEAAKEAAAWNSLNRNSFSALNAYKDRYPDSVHLEELDDLMWEVTKGAVNENSLTRYLSVWPTGNHAAEANRALGQINEWGEIKHSHDIFQIAEYRRANSDCAFINEINAVYSQEKRAILDRMHNAPSEFGIDEVNGLIGEGIFKRWELVDEGLMTDESWDKLIADREAFPDLAPLQMENPNLQAPEGCTDIYLFGTPGTGKTCLLMGLTGANGQGYHLNMRVAGGPYASALQQYTEAGITPGGTFGNFVTVINGRVNEERRRGKVIEHNINLVEMSGEEFALRISESQSVSLANMGTGATNLLRNNNKKAFFIIVDSSKDRIKVEYIDNIRDDEGNIIEQVTRKRYISQLDILNKFMGLFELPENQDIMKNVTSIHFIVTKSDLLGDGTERLTKARELLLSRYMGPVTSLKNYCRRTKRINYSTDYNPHVFTFSLGKFYLGDVFEFEPQETLQIVNAIRSVTGGEEERGWFDKFKKILR